MKKFLSFLIIFFSFAFAKTFMGIGLVQTSNIETEARVEGNLINKISENNYNDKYNGIELIFGYEADYHRIYGSLERTSIEDKFTYIDTGNKYNKTIPMTKLLFNFDLKRSFFHPSLEFYAGLSIGYGTIKYSKIKLFQKKYYNSDFTIDDAKGLVTGAKIGGIFSINQNSKVDFSYKVENTNMKSQTNIFINQYTIDINLKIKSMSTMSLAYIYKF